MHDALILASLLTVLAANGLLTAVCLIARRVSKRGAQVRGVAEGLAIVRPLRGSAAASTVSNGSLLAQDYREIDEIVFVASRPEDEGLRLARSQHGADPRVTCTIAPAVPGKTTDKARNMVAAWGSTKSPFVAFCDADIVLPEWLVRRCMERFDHPNVGAVFAPVVHCFEGGLGVLLAQLASGDKLAAIRAFDRLGVLGVLEGGLMILRRSAVDHIGGIQVIVGTIADDLRLGTELQRGGFRLHAGPTIRHEVGRASFAQMVAQYHRWMVCQRSERPSLMWPQLLFHPVVLPLIVLALTHLSPAAWAILAGSLAWRVALTLGIERSIVRSAGLRFGWWSLARPIADLVHFTFGVSAYLVPFVSWGGVRYQLGPRGRIARCSPYF